MHPILTILPIMTAHTQSPHLSVMPRSLDPLVLLSFNCPSPASCACSLPPVNCLVNNCYKSFVYNFRFFFFLYLACLYWLGQPTTWLNSILHPVPCLHYTGAEENTVMLAGLTLNSWPWTSRGLLASYCVSRIDSPKKTISYLLSSLSACFLLH